MQADIKLVNYIATTLYDLSPILGSIKPLCGYSDRNFLLTNSTDHKTYVLKIVNKDESIKEITDNIDEVTDNAHEYCQANPLQPEVSFLVPKLIRTTADKLSTFVTVCCKKVTDSGIDADRLANAIEDIPMEEEDFDSSVDLVQRNVKLAEYFDGITMFDYINSHSPSLVIKPASGQKSSDRLKGEKLYRKLGRVCNELFVFLRTQRHLIDQLKQARGDSFPWQVKTCEQYLRRLLDTLYPDQCHPRRILVEQVLDEYSKQIKPQLDLLPEFILHGDLCNKNLLLNWEQNSPHKDKVCIIDFQDLQVGQQVIELAVMMLYNVIEQEQMPFEKALKFIPRWIYLGYQSNIAAHHSSLEPGELLLVPTLMKLRLCQSLLNGQLAFKKDPQNSYVMQTNQRGWQLLELMSDERTNYGNSKMLSSFWLEE